MAQGDPPPGPFLALNRVKADLDIHHRWLDLIEGHAILTLLHVATVAILVLGYVADLAGYFGVYLLVLNDLGVFYYFGVAVGAGRPWSPVVTIFSFKTQVAMHFVG